MTGTALCTNALTLLNICAQGETPEAADVADAFARLNRMIRRFRTQGLTMGARLRTVKALAANTATYTIGVGGAINVAWPSAIDPRIGARLIPDTSLPAASQLEIPIAVFTDQEWTSVSMKAMTGTLVSGIYVDRSWAAGLGVIQVTPVPTASGTSLVLYTPSPIPEYATPATDLSFADGIDELLEYNLAKRLLVAFPGTDPQTKALIIHEADESLADVKRTNIRTQELSTGLAGVLFGRGRPYNILTGE